MLSVIELKLGKLGEEMKGLEKALALLILIAIVRKQDILCNYFLRLDQHLQLPTAQHLGRSKRMQRSLVLSLEVLYECRSSLLGPARN
jgi:hypothetical protein